MKYDFTTLPDRHGRDAIAVDGLGKGFAPDAPQPGFDAIPMWVADMNFVCLPTIQQAVIERVQHPAFGYFDPTPEYYGSIIRWQETRNDVTGLTAEAIGFAQEELLAAGALDVYTTPIGMKKGRPAVLLSCMCRMEDRERLLGLLFRHTTTLGVRENVCRRYTLERGERTVDTPHGPVRLKTASGWGVVRSKPEYEDVARIARGQGISLAEVCDWLK